MTERGTKVRVGVGLGVQTSTDPGRFAALIDGLEALGFDSLWLSERMSSGPDALTALTYAAARSDRLKLGTAVTVLPGPSSWRRWTCSRRADSCRRSAWA